MTPRDYNEVKIHACADTIKFWSWEKSIECLFINTPYTRWWFQPPQRSKSQQGYKVILWSSTYFPYGEEELPIGTFIRVIQYARNDAGEIIAGEDVNAIARNWSVISWILYILEWRKIQIAMALGKTRRSAQTFTYNLAVIQ